MSRLSTLCAAAALAVTAFVATSPAQAGFHLIRWQDTGFCQIWDEAVPNLLPLSYYVIASTSVPTLGDVIADKNAMLRQGACAY